MLRIICIALALPIAATAQEPAAVLKHDGWVAAVAFAPNGKTLASAGADNVVRLWEVDTWKPKGVLKGHTDCVCAVAFSPNSKWIASGGYDQSVKIWNADSLEELKTFTGFPSAILAVIVGDTKGIVTGRVDGTVSWASRSKDFFRHKSWVNSLTHKPKTLTYASASSDGTVRLFGSGISSANFEGGAGEVRCVAFSPDGKLLAAGNRYHTVRVWDVASKKEVVTLKGHMSDVWSIAFNPDGKTLAAADTDWKKPSKVKLWDTATWKERGALEVPGEILSIAYSPKGDWLAVGSWDKSVRVFAIGK